MPSARLIVGDARRLPLPDESLHCVVTSPPYWGLRDYGLTPLVWDSKPGCDHQWGIPSQPGTKLGQDGNTNGFYGGGIYDSSKVHAASFKPEPSAFCVSCGAWRGTLGLEPTAELYVQHIVAVFQEVRRVLRSDGTLWLNLGDSYIGSGSPGGDFRDGKGGDTYLRPYHRRGMALKPKDMAGIPWRVAFALQADGWWLRSDIIWAKPNPMPESVKDRPTRSHEYLFLLAKSERYYYDQEAIREAWTDFRSSDIRRAVNGSPAYDLKASEQEARAQNLKLPNIRPVGNPNIGRNKRSVWTIPSEPYSGAHFATFPTKLVEPCILAGTSERGVCPRCGAPWVRALKSSGTGPQRTHRKNTQVRLTRIAGQAWSDWKALNPNVVLGWEPSCRCGMSETNPAVVLDPFMGSGTVGVVALRLGRSFVGVDLKPEYVKMAAERIGSRTQVFQ